MAAACSSDEAKVAALPVEAPLTPEAAVDCVARLPALRDTLAGAEDATACGDARTRAPQLSAVRSIRRLLSSGIASLAWCCG